MENNLARAVFLNGTVQAAAIVATDIVNESIRIHDLSPLAAACLGRGLMGACFLGLNLKSDDTVTLRFKGDGPLGGLLTQAKAGGKLRGYVGDPYVELPLNSKGKFDVGGAIGHQGSLYVTKDMGMKEPYTGTSELVTSEIAEDLAYYFLKSEQTPAAVSLGVLIDRDLSCRAAGGFIIKALPGADEAKLEAAEQWLSVLPPVSMLTDQLNDPVEMLRALFPNEEPENMTTESWTLSCDCSRDRIEKALISLGEKELTQMIEEDHRAELTCSFCNKKYFFNEDELKDILAKARTKYGIIKK